MALHIRVHRRVKLASALFSCFAAATHVSAADPAAWRREAIDAAITSARMESDAYRSGDAFAAIARAQIAMGDESGAEASLRSAQARTQSIVQPEFRGWVQHEIVQAQLELDDVIGARQTAESIEATRPRGAAYALLARRMLQAGNTRGAREIAESIRDAGAAGQALADIVATTAAAGDLATARNVQRRIDDRYYAAIALAHVASAEARAGKFEQARATVLRTSRPHRSEAIGQLIASLLERGESQRALALAGDIEEPAPRAVVIARLALDSKRNGNADRARELFAASASVLGSTGDEPRRRVGALAQIARLHSLGGLDAEARSILARARDEASALRGWDRDTTLESIARGYTRLSDYDAALSVVGGIEDRIARALLTRDVVALRELGGANAALTPVNEQRDPLASAAAQFGLLAARVGRAARADVLQTIVAARASIAHIDDPLLPPAALAALAAASLSAGDPALALDIFSQAQRSAASLARPEQRALAHVHVANALNDRLMFLGRPASAQDACALDSGCVAP